MAKGIYFARMDSDDIALPQRFERQLEWIRKNDADICGSWVKLFGATRTRILKHPITDAAIKMEMLFSTPFAHPTVMMKRALIKHLRYDKAWEKCEDYDLWERAARAGLKMTNVPEVLLLYRQHSSQISTNAALHQQLLTQKIRRRYWSYISDSMTLERKWIDDVLNLREPSPSKSNMDHVDAAFLKLLQCNEGEARATIFDHARRLYFRAAAECPDVVRRWVKLNQLFGQGLALGTILELKFLSLFRFHPQGNGFKNLKKLFFYLGLK